MQAQMQEPPINQTDTVNALGRRARWLSLGYWVFVVYYIAIAVLVARHGVRFTSVGQFANDLVRLSNVFAPLFAYIVVNAAMAMSLCYFVSMHTAARWGAAVVAILLALVATGVYAYSLLRWLDEGTAASMSWRQFVGLGLSVGYVILAILVTILVRRLQRYVLVENVWLLKYGMRG